MRRNLPHIRWLLGDLNYLIKNRILLVSTSSAQKWGISPAMTDKQGSPSGAGHQLKTPFWGTADRAPRAGSSPRDTSSCLVWLESVWSVQHPAPKSLDYSVSWFLYNVLLLKAYDGLHSVGLMYTIFKAFVSQRQSCTTNGLLKSTPRGIVKALSRRCFVFLFFFLLVHSISCSKTPKV